MKKFLLIFLFIPALVLQAMPPPDDGLLIFNGQEMVYTVDEAVFNVQVIQGIEAQEVAWDIIGNAELFQSREFFAEEIGSIELRNWENATVLYGNLESLYKPPSATQKEKFLTNDFKFFLDRQHCNYGYPFSAN